MKKTVLLVLTVLANILLLCGCSGEDSVVIERERQEAFNNGYKSAFFTDTDGEWLYYMNYSNGNLEKMKMDDMSEKQFVMTVASPAEDGLLHLLNMFHLNDSLIYTKLDASGFKSYYVYDGTSIENDTLEIRGYGKYFTIPYMFDGSRIYFMNLKETNKIYYIERETMEDMFADEIKGLKYNGKGLENYLLDLEQNEFNQLVGELCVISDATELGWIYCIARNTLYVYGTDTDGDDAVWQVSTDGKTISRITDSKMFEDMNETKITDDTFAYNSVVYNDDGFIYTVSSYDWGTYELWIKSFDGTQKKQIAGVYVDGITTKLTDLELIESTGRINAIKNYVFYVEAMTGHLCRINSDGSNRIVLSASETEALYIVDDWLFYYNVDEGAWYRMNFDGTINEFVMYY